MAQNDGRADEQDAFVQGAFSGAMAGAATGNPYAVVGGAIIGGAIGIFGASKQNDAARKAERERADALRKANLFKDVAKKQVASLRSTGRNLEASKGIKPQSIPTGSTPTSAIGGGIGSSAPSSTTSAGTF